MASQTRRYRIKSRRTMTSPVSHLISNYSTNTCLCKTILWNWSHKFKNLALWYILKVAVIRKPRQRGNNKLARPLNLYEGTQTTAFKRVRSWLSRGTGMKLLALLSCEKCEQKSIRIIHQRLYHCHSHRINRLNRKVAVGHLRYRLLWNNVQEVKMDQRPVKYSQLMRVHVSQGLLATRFCLLLNKKDARKFFHTSQRSYEGIKKVNRRKWIDSIWFARKWLINVWE